MNAKLKRLKIGTLAATRPGRQCAHCNGSGREPRSITLEFSTSGDRRGALRRLATECGIDPGSLSRMLAGRTVPPLAKIVLVAHALGVSESRLIHFPPIWYRLLTEINGDGD